MKYCNEVSVKHGGKIVAVSSDQAAAHPDAEVVKIEEFETLEEAVNFFLERDEDTGEVVATGEEEVLNLVNQQHRANKMNAVRAGHSRPKSAFAALRKAAEDPAIKEQLQDFLETLGLGGVDL